MIDIDTRCIASPITDLQVKLLNHLGRSGMIDIEWLIPTIENAVMMLRSEGITVGVLEIALYLDMERRNHPSVAATARTVFEKLKEHYS